MTAILNMGFIVVVLLVMRGLLVGAGALVWRVVRMIRWGKWVRRGR